MINLYKKDAIPKSMKLIRLNDVFFNKVTSPFLDDRAIKIIQDIDKSKLVSKYTIESRFDGTILSTDKLSTSCKTALNVLYNSDKVFDICECGDTALDIIYSFDKGNITCDYPLVSFNVKQVKVIDNKGTKVLTDYSDITDWWKYENK